MMGKTSPWEVDEQFGVGGLPIYPAPVSGDLSEIRKCP
jgi:hypothetical protein